MNAGPDPLVFDTGPLRHFAAQGWLRVLDFITTGRGVLVPESVERELIEQSHTISALHEVLDADWITIDRSDVLVETMAFARYEQRLVAEGKNRGECGVLALGETRGLEVVLDDAEPRNLARENGIRCTATVPLLCRAIREELLTVSMVEKLADDLISGTYFLPFPTGGFRQYALENGLIDP